MLLDQNRERLKPCPFCGGEPRLATFQTRKGEIINVHCPVCQAQSRSFKLEGKQEHDARVTEYAIASWNRRA